MHECLHRYLVVKSKHEVVGSGLLYLYSIYSYLVVKPEHEVVRSGLLYLGLPGEELLRTLERLVHAWHLVLLQFQHY